MRSVGSDAGERVNLTFWSVCSLDVHWTFAGNRTVRPNSVHTNGCPTRPAPPKGVQQDESDSRRGSVSQKNDQREESAAVESDRN